MGFRVLGFRVEGSGFRVDEFRVWGLGLRVWGWGVSALGCLGLIGQQGRRV